MLNLLCTKKGYICGKITRSYHCCTTWQWECELHSWIDRIKCIENIRKQIVTFWTRYDRKKSSVLKYKSDWLNQHESIPIKSLYKKNQQRVRSPHRGPQKLDFVKSSGRTNRRRLAHPAELDESEYFFVTQRIWNKKCLAIRFRWGNFTINGDRYV